MRNRCQKRPCILFGVTYRENKEWLVPGSEFKRNSPESSVVLLYSDCGHGEPSKVVSLLPGLEAPEGRLDFDGGVLDPGVVEVREAGLDGLDGPDLDDLFPGLVAPESPLDLGRRVRHLGAVQIWQVLLVMAVGSLVASWGPGQVTNPIRGF